MSITSAGASASSSPIDPLVRQLVERIDQNKDGKISTDEFGSFLTELIRRDTAPAAAGTASAPIKVAMDPSDETTGPRDIPPSEWTDNNAPYGVTKDGQRFLVNLRPQPMSATPPLTVVLNWTSEIRR